MSAGKDKYDPFRFNGICPTCGQTFLSEQVEHLKSQLTEAREALEKVKAYLWHADVYSYDLEQARKIIDATLFNLTQLGVVSNKK